MKNVVIKESRIDAKGIFAAHDIKAGETIIVWHPKILDPSKLDQVPAAEKEYIAKISDDKYYLMQSPEKFMNHSCDPNSQVENDADIAIKDIPKGAEVTSNYGADGSPVTFKCSCGSQNCVGHIPAYK